jgi:diguanylate cyclase (GGDEF)-like protein
MAAMLHSFRVQLTVAYTLGLAALVVVLALVQGQIAGQHALRDQSDTLQTLARSTGVVLADGLAERLREVELLAQSGRWQEAHWPETLELLRRTRSHVSWVGLTDAQGRVVEATDGMLVGQDVSARPWFQAARLGPHTGDVHTALLLAQMLPASPRGEPLRFIDFAAPLRDERGQLIAVLGMHVNWEWPQHIIDNLRSPLALQQGVRVFIFDREGRVIHRPRDVSAAERPLSLQTPAQGPSIQTWDDGQAYLTAAVRVAARSPATDLGWTVVTRQPVDEARAGAREAHRAAAVAGALTALLVALLAWGVVGRLTRPLHHIALAARSLRQGQLDTPMPVVDSPREVRELSRALSEMTTTLVNHERELEAANRELEQRVAERTAELTLATDSLRAANARLEQLASRDTLTGLPNRRSLTETLHAEVRRHRRSGQALTLVLADVDHFKKVNDTHGHAAGDAVLRAVGRALVGGCRVTDLVGRFGGEEFLLLMPDTDLAGARVACEKLRERVQAMAGPVPVTMSFGVVSPAQYFSTMEEALNAADQALYRAKAEGRNRVCAYEGQPPQAAPSSGFLPLEDA